MERSVLVSGGGIAGSALAFWLSRRGFRPTVVERAPDPRDGGAPVDVRGEAVDVVERMGALDRIRRARTDIRDLRFVDDAGKRLGGVDMRRFQRDRDLEVLRGDLARILRETAADAEHVFGDWPTELRQDSGGVEVAFRSGHVRRFGLVVGADGLHSGVRQLVFGPEDEFRHHLGYCAAVVTVPKELAADRSVLLHNTPGKVVALYSSGNHDDARALFLFRSPEEHDGGDRGDLEQQRQTVLDAFTGQSPKVSELLDELRRAPDFFFDSLSQIRMPTWSEGRVALVGDAAHAPALLSGAGSSLALVGAERLARELGDGDDHRTAFARYENAHRPAAERGQRGTSSSARVLVPDTRFGLWTRNHLSRLAAPLTAARRPARKNAEEPKNAEVPRENAEEQSAVETP